MKTFLIGLPIAMITTAALAGSFEAPAIVDDMEASSIDWSGVYAGGWYSMGSGENYYPSNLGQQIYAFDGSSYGVMAGYNFDSGSIVYGIEADYTAGIDLFETDDPTWMFGSILDVKARVGFKVANALPYAFIGESIAEFGDMPGGDVDILSGYVVGAGVDYLVTDSIFLGVEYTYRDLEKTDFDGAGYDMYSTSSSIRARAGMKF